MPLRVEIKATCWSLRQRRSAPLRTRRRFRAERWWRSRALNLLAYRPAA